MIKTQTIPTDKKIVYLKVFRLNDRKFLNGLSLEFLNKFDLMEGKEDQIYEFYENEIENMVSDYNSKSIDIELREEQFQMSPEDLKKIYSKPLSEMSYEQLLRYYKYAMQCDETEAIAMASMWDEINNSSKNKDNYTK